MQMEKTAVLERAKGNLEALEATLASQHEAIKKALGTAAKQAASDIAAGTYPVSSNITVEFQRDTTKSFRDFIGKVELLSEVDGGIAIAEDQRQNYLYTDPSDSVQKINVGVRTG